MAPLRGGIYVKILPKNVTNTYCYNVISSFLYAVYNLRVFVPSNLLLNISIDTSSWKMGLYHFFRKFDFFFCTCHNFFFPFLCANNYYTSLLLIVCALRWYVKSLYRHFFLEDIAKHAGVTQKMAPPPRQMS